MGFQFTFKYRVVPLVKAERFIPAGEHCADSGTACPYLKVAPEGMARWCDYLKRAIGDGTAAELIRVKPCGVKLECFT